MDNMRYYERFRSCPPEAMREIAAGRLKGKTDINPMWRIKALTEVFGPQGVGWWLQNVKYWTDTAPGGEIMAFCSLELVYMDDGKESQPVPGIGGSGLVNAERSGLVANDEAYKMAYTDAISVAAKGLGVAADVYWGKDATKYTAKTWPAERPITCRSCGKIIKPTKKGGRVVPATEVAKKLGGLCPDCWRAVQQHNSGQAAEKEGA